MSGPRVFGAYTVENDREAFVPLPDTTPLEMLDAWPWPRWEFVSATPTDDGVTVALAPIAGPHCPRISIDPDTRATVYDSRAVVDAEGREAGGKPADGRVNR